MRNYYKTFISIISTLCIFAFPSSASASSADYGYISAIIATSTGAVLFNTSGNRSNPLPTCQGAGLGARFALNGSTVAGQAQVAVLLNAYNLKKKIFIYGAGSCTIWDDTETVYYFAVE